MSQPQPQTPRPAPPPWGALITKAQRSAGLSAREAARRAGISEGRWRQITAGYQIVSPGSHAPVTGPPATVAKMAAAVGLTAVDLTEAGRPDAAEVFTTWQKDPAEDLVDRIRAMSPGEAQELLAAIAVQIGAVTTLQQADERRYGT